ncbi:hypothetical protein FEF33_04385 [Moraxella osloensis]|jgi:hypothetical protein|nr:hypothetical protein FEF33_04385 [Moraxella osloensis]RVU81253.1 hypothetical protein EOL70_27915 [Leucothrix sargassi]
MQQSDKSDEIGDESVDFSDLSKMFGFMIEKTASSVIKKANAQHLEQTKELIASLQNPKPQADFSDEELLLIGQAVVDLIEAGDHPDINNLLIEKIPTLAVEREISEVKLAMKALNEKMQTLEAKRVKELNDDNVLIALNAFEDGEKGQEGTGESASKVESIEEQEQRSDESDD